MNASPITSPPGYELLGGLGRGGMGVVTKARDRNINRAVALKMIRSASQATPLEQARFQLEVDYAARDHAEEASDTNKALTDFFLKDVLLSARPGDGGKGRDTKVGGALDAAARRIEEAPPGNVAVHGNVRYALGVTYAELGDYQRTSRYSAARPRSRPGYPAGSASHSLASRHNQRSDSGISVPPCRPLWPSSPITNLWS